MNFANELVQKIVAGSITAQLELVSVFHCHHIETWPSARNAITHILVPYGRAPFVLIDFQCDKSDPALAIFVRYHQNVTNIGSFPCSKWLRGDCKWLNIERNRYRILKLHFEVISSESYGQETNLAILISRTGKR